MHSFAVIPAAGRSRRMGRPKLLLPWHDGTVFSALLTAWKHSRVERVVVVVHPDDEEIAAIGRAMGVHVVVPAAPPAEMKDSVALGLAWIEARFGPPADAAWLLAPADLPLLSPQVIDVLLSTHVANCSAAQAGVALPILVPTYSGRRGHPVLFPWSLASEVQHLAAGEGVNALIKRAAVSQIECGAAAAPADIDTPDDYQRLHKR
jgi:molybdenum cofactor cytidylyltransferase